MAMSPVATKRKFTGPLSTDIYSAHAALTVFSGTTVLAIKCKPDLIMLALPQFAVKPPVDPIKLEVPQSWTSLARRAHVSVTSQPVAYLLERRPG
jgi:hypothetical protein